MILKRKTVAPPRPRIVEAAATFRPPGVWKNMGPRRRFINRMIRGCLGAYHNHFYPDWFRLKALETVQSLRRIEGATLGNTFETDLVDLILNATAIVGVAENHSSPITTITVALHTNDPGEAGDQTTNEAAYTDYARETVARTSGGWSVGAGQATLVANLDFTIAGAASSETITHASLGSGVGDKLFVSGPVTPNIPVTEGTTPRLTTATAFSFD